LTLPYQSRDPLAVRDMIRRAVFVLSCDGGEERALIFLVKGLRDRIIACKGLEVFVRFEEMSTSDSLSGLTLRLRRPVLYIDDCRVRFMWKKSRFVLDVNEVIKCTRCVSVTA